MTAMKNGLYWHGSTWWMQYRHAGRTVRESTGCTKREDAKAVADAKRTASRQGQLVPGAAKTTLADLFMLYVADAVAKHREPPKLKRLAEWFEVAMTTGDDGAVIYAGGWRATAIDYGVLQRYVAERQKVASDSTVHNELAALRRSFRLGKKAGKVLTVPEFPMPQVQNVRESFFSTEELERLLTLLPEYLRAAVHFAALTGMRAENVFSLAWEHVDFGRGLVSVPFGMTKSGEPLAFPFAHKSTLEVLLRVQEQARRGPFVFHRLGERIKSYHGAWRTAVEALGADGYGTQYDPKVGQTKKVLKRFHDLRHTFAQRATEMGMAEATLLELGGWKTAAMLKRYRIVNQEAKRAAAAQLDKFIEVERQKATQVLDFKKRASGGSR